jgi:hypothetical protein
LSTALFVGLENAVETAEDREWKDDLSVFGLLVIATEEIGDGPDERTKDSARTSKTLE